MSASRSPATSVDVYLSDRGDDILLGQAFFSTARGQVTTTFRYADDYLTRKGAWPIEPGLPLFAGPQAVAGGLPHSFTECTPERWGRNLIKKRRQAEDVRAGRVDCGTGTHRHSQERGDSSETPGRNERRSGSCRSVREQSAARPASTSRCTPAGENPLRRKRPKAARPGSGNRPASQLARRKGMRLQLGFRLAALQALRALCELPQDPHPPDIETNADTLPRTHHFGSREIWKHRQQHRSPRSQPRAASRVMKATSWWTTRKTSRLVDRWLAESSRANSYLQFLLDFATDHEKAASWNEALDTVRVEQPNIRTLKTLPPDVRARIAQAFTNHAEERMQARAGLTQPSSCTH